MPAYEAARFTPPAPLAKVNLRDPSTGTKITDVPMLLDTGADVTLIPEDSANLLGLLIDPNQSYALIGFDGSKSNAQAAQVDLIFLKRVFRGKFLLINDSCGILGRDVLNEVSLLFDGPNLIWNEQ